jgi:nucleotide-binding universal stress UspA family protein
MEIKKLLFVTKFEELGFDALQSLLSLTKVALNHVVFVNVIERDRVAMQRGVGYQKEEELRLRETANIRFIDWAEDLYERGMEVGVYIPVGSLVSEVIKAAQKEETDLIVIGRSDKGMLEQFYSGSDITEIIRRASIPVLVYKPISENAFVLEKPFERILLAMDWSAASLKAVEYLKGLKDVTRLIDVMYVASKKELTGSTAMEIQKTRKQKRRDLDKVCDTFEAAGIQSRSHVYIGDTVEEIERAAREHQASMIVVGSSSKAGWVEKWIGSIPREIAEESIYPTLIIPPEPQ